MAAARALYRSETANAVRVVYVVVRASLARDVRINNRRPAATCRKSWIRTSGSTGTTPYAPMVAANALFPQQAGVFECAILRLWRPPPWPMRVQENEQIDGSVALIFVVVTLALTWLARDGLAHLANVGAAEPGISSMDAQSQSATIGRYGGEFIGFPGRARQDLWGKRLTRLRRVERDGTSRTVVRHCLAHSLPGPHDTPSRQPPGAFAEPD